MKKTLVLSMLFVFTMAITSPIIAEVNPQEPVKKECTDKKGCCDSKKECTDKKECSDKKGCCDSKKECSDKKGGCDSKKTCDKKEKE